MKPAVGPISVPAPTSVVRVDTLASSDSSDSSDSFVFDCTDCCHQHTTVCEDCVVSFIVNRQPDDAVVVDADAARAVRLLGRAGLVPGIRHSVRAG